MANLTKLVSKSSWVAALVFIVAPICVSQELGSIIYNSWKGLCSISEITGEPTCHKSRYWDVSWQPHGNRILAIGSEGIVLLDGTGHLANKVEGESGGSPRWSPDGQYIYALSGKPETSVVRWDASGKNRIVIPVTGAGHLRPPLHMLSFSPSGKRAAILTREFKEILISDVSDESLTVKKTLPRGFSYVAQSVWLDNEHLLFIGKKDSTRGELWELDVQSETTTRLGIDGLWLRDFVALSPDAKSVVVTGTKDGEDVSWNLWLYSLETSRLKRLTSGLRSEDVEPSWRR